MFKDILSDEDWREPVGTIPEPADYDDPELFKVLTINDQFIEGRRYLFKVIMDIPQPDGSIYSIESSEVELIVSGDLLPSPIKDIVVTQGDSISDITISWIIPKWTYDVNRDNSFFLIERSSDGGLNWIPVVDEISLRSGLGLTAGKPEDYDENNHHKNVTAIGDDKMQCEYVDHDVTKGTDYIYRITNSAENPEEVKPGKPDKGFYVQSEEPVASAPAYLYLPVITGMEGTWDVVGEGEPLEATASFRWTLRNPYHDERMVPTWSLRTWKMNPGFNPVYEDMPIDSVTGEDGTFTFGNHVETYAGELYTQYYYMIVMNMDGKEYYVSDDVFNMKTSAGEPVDKLILGKMVPVPAEIHFITDMAASRDRLGKIVLTWNRTDYSEYATPYTYQYKFESDTEYTDLVVADPNGNGQAMEAEITAASDVDIETKGRLFLKVASGLDTYIPEEGLFYDVLHLPSDLSIKAYYNADGDYHLEWDGSNFLKTDDAVYGYEVSKDGSVVADAAITDIDSKAMKIEVPEITSPRDNMYAFNIVIENSKYPEDRIVSAASTYLLPIVQNVAASKGTSKDRISVDWDACGIAGASYAVYRYEDDIDTMTKIATSVTNHYEDVVSPEDYGKSFRYTVSVVKDTCEGLVQTGFNTVKNTLGNEEPANMGYVFGPVAFMPEVVIQQLDDGSLKPYFTVEFTPDRFIAEYKISGDPSDKPYVFKLSDFTKIVDGRRTNGKNTDEIGFASYDTEADRIVFNVAFNVLDDDLKIPDITVEGLNGSVSEKKELKDVNARRALAALDYANIFNSDLKRVIADADKKFGSDWWGDDNGIFGADTGSQQTYVSKGVTVRNCHVADLPSKAAPGDIIFNHYSYKAARNEKGEIKDANDKDGLAEYDTNGIITLMSTNGKSAAGYLGDDPLNIIGRDGDKNSTAMKMIVQHDINGNPVKYPEVFITIENIEKWNEAKEEYIWSGAYVVSIGGADPERIEITNEYLKTKPY